MIPILTLAEMKEVERLATAAGQTEFELILSAGEAVFQSIKSMLDDTEEERFDLGLPSLPPEDNGIPGANDPGERSDLHRPPAVAFVCGKGHNGADAMAAALHCVQAGLGVVVYQIHSDRYSTESRRLREQLAEAGVPVHPIRSAVDLPVFEEADLIVDGLLGNGLKGAPEGILGSLIHGINRSVRPVLSIDVPSGVESDSGVIPGAFVRADSTLCLGALKPSAVFFPAGAAYGKVGYSPIAFDEKRLFAQPSHLAMYTEEDALDNLPLKTWKSNKYTAGKVLVISGCRGMHGAAALSANGALRAGGGLVRAAVPAGIYRDLSAHLLEIIGTPIGGESDFHFAPAHLAELSAWIDWADAIVIGPGLGKHPDTRLFLDQVMALLQNRRVVVDGDALAYFETAASTAGLGNFVLTPHVGEYRRIGGRYEGFASLEILDDARTFAKTRGLFVVVKGSTTLVAHPGGDVTVTTSGNPGMATAGSGDVLAGILGTLLTQLPPEEATPLAVFLHGRAGEAARRDRGTIGMTASDLILYLPLALKELEDVLREAGEDDEDEDA
jgi:NAD(P)H-hydrate epimerase